MRRCDSINFKENIQYTEIVRELFYSWWCVNKTSRNYGADTNSSFIITYEIPKLLLNEFNRKYPRGLHKWTLKFEKLKNINYLR